MRILVCGDRNWTNREAIERELRKFPPDTVVIHGAAPGADTIAGEVAKDLGLTVEAYEADWWLYGRAAGPIRNQRLLEAQPDQGLAFHADLENSKGTKDMVRRMCQAGKPIVVFES